jgi:hypothetical protein
MIIPLYHDLVKNLLSILAKCKTIHSILPKNSSKYFDYSIQHYDIEVSHIKTMEKKLKRRQGVEGKTRSWREDKELKSKEEDQEKRAQDKKMKVLDLMT